MRRKLRRVLFLIMTVIITFVGCGESNKTKTVHVQSQQRYIMRQSMEHAGYRTVRHTMKRLLMDMFVPAEQENKNVPKFGTQKRITKAWFFFCTQF